MTTLTEGTRVRFLGSTRCTGGGWGDLEIGDVGTVIKTIKDRPELFVDIDGKTVPVSPEQQMMAALLQMPVAWPLLDSEVEVIA